ncbi:MAG: TonB family protein [Vicinamibacteria bacterium]|nr:TonB family protein [Vicinamibacteria bacterium]
MTRHRLPTLGWTLLQVLAASNLVGQAAPQPTPEPALKVMRPKPRPAATAPAAVAPPPATRPAPVSRAHGPLPLPRPSLPIRADDPDVVEFVARIGATMQAGDASVLEAAYDVAGLFDAAIAGTSGPPALIGQFRSQALGWTSGSATLADELRSGSATLQLLRVREGVRGRPEAVFRRVGVDGGVNFFVYALGRDSSRPRVVDSLALSYGEWQSETLRRRWIASLEVARLGDRAPAAELDRYEPEAKRIQGLQTAGQFAEALAALVRLPASVQANRDALFWRLVLAQKVGLQELAAAVRALEARYPRDPAIDMYKLDVLTGMGEYDAAVAAAERIAAAVGGDPYMDTIAAGILFQKGDYRAARARAAQSAAAEPTLVNPWFALLAISLAERDHSETAWALTVLETRFQQPIGDLTAMPQYATFVQTPEYTKWARSRPAPGSVVGGLPPLPPPPTPVRVGGNIQEPRKLTHVDAVYPDIAKQARVQGIVILECLITPAGEVGKVEVMRGIPLLDQAAIDAVKQWRYAPTLLNGVPVPVIMTVTVNFKLS